MSECKVKVQLTVTMKDAMRNRDKPRLGTIRMALAKLTLIEVDEKVLDDTRALEVLDKMVKQRCDAMNQFESAGHTDLTEQEKLELTVIQEFLPEQLTSDEFSQLVDDAITQSGAHNMRDMGKVMRLVRPKVQRRADMNEESKTVEARLN